MNRSYSKIRHIQESNLRLEKRMLSEQDNPEIDEEGKRYPERQVKHKKTNKIVGIHKKGVGFTPTPHGEELGFEFHPTDIPHGTILGGTEVGDFDYEDNDFDFKMPPYDDKEEEITENNPFNFSNGFDDYNFPEEIKERLMSIHDLLDESMEDPENDPSNYEDMYDFASIIIGDVIHKLNQEFGEEFEEYEDDVEDYLRNNEDEYIFAFHESHSDFDDDEYNF